jgi:hypothetical protein
MGLKSAGIADNIQFTLDSLVKTFKPVEIENGSLGLWLV